MLKSSLHIGFPAYPKDIRLDAWYPSTLHCDIKQRRTTPPESLKASLHQQSAGWEFPIRWSAQPDAEIATNHKLQAKHLQHWNPRIHRFSCFSFKFKDQMQKKCSYFKSWSDEVVYVISQHKDTMPDQLSIKQNRKTAMVFSWGTLFSNLRHTIQVWNVLQDHKCLSGK